MSILPTFIAAYEHLISVPDLSEGEYVTDEGEISFFYSKKVETTLYITNVIPFKGYAPLGALFDFILESNRFLEIQSIGCGFSSCKLVISETKKHYAKCKPVEATLTPLEMALKKNTSETGLNYLLKASHYNVFPNDIVKYISEHLEEVNIADTTGLPPLIIACLCDGTTLPILQALVDAGADVTAVDKRGFNVLQYILDGDYPLEREFELTTGKLISSLIDKGIDINYRGPDGYVPLFRAAQESSSVLKLLVERGINLNVYKEGRGVLWYADLNLDSFKYLLTLDIDLYHRDNNGFNILDYCLKDSSMEKYCQLLIERNVGPTFSKLSPEELERYVKLVKP